MVVMEAIKVCHALRECSKSEKILVEVPTTKSWEHHLGPSLATKILRLLDLAVKFRFRDALAISGHQRLESCQQLN